MSLAPQAVPLAAGASAGLSAAPQAVPHAAAVLFSSANQAMLDNDMVISSFTFGSQKAPLLSVPIM